MKKSKKNKRRNTGIIFVKGSALKTGTHVRKERMGKDCVFFDEQLLTCTNTTRLHEFCNSDSCPYFHKKENLSPYDEDFITIPEQAGTHERSNEYIGISKNIGTPCHVGYLKGDGYRRNKARCIYYEKAQKLCSNYGYRCPGSSRCSMYKEKN